MFVLKLKCIKMLYSFYLTNVLKLKQIILPKSLHCINYSDFRNSLTEIESKTALQVPIP